MPREPTLTPALQRKIVNFIIGGGSKPEAAATFNVSIRSVYRALEANEKEVARMEPQPQKSDHNNHAVKMRGKTVCRCAICGLDYYYWPEDDVVVFLCSQTCYEKMVKGVRTRWTAMMGAGGVDEETMAARVIKRAQRENSYFAFRSPEPVYNELIDDPVADELGDLFE